MSNVVMRAQGADPTSTATMHGMRVDLADLQEATARAIGWGRADSPNLVVTPNVDHFLRWQSVSSFRDVYARASLRVLDGAPLVLMARLFGYRSARRVTGVDLFFEVCEAAARLGLPVAIIGGTPVANDLATRELKRRFPGLKVFFSAAPSREELADPVKIVEIAHELAREPSKVVALCLGSPKQELIFSELVEKGSGNGAYLAVGAAVDFAAGTVTRAPRWLQNLGLEWLFRLLGEPRRLWRRYLVDDAPFFRYLAASLFRRHLVTAPKK